MFFLKIFEILYSVRWLTWLLTSILGFLGLRVLWNRDKNLPPGPTGLPIVGYLPFLTSTPHVKLRDLSKKYGDVMCLNVFGYNFIILGSYDSVHEAFVNQGSEFAGRPDQFIVSQADFFKFGIVQSQGEPWKIHRRFALSTLRDFGFGKMSAEMRIQEISEDIIKELEEIKGKPFEIKELLANSTANVICSMVFDRHFKLDDPVFVKFMDAFTKLLSDVTMWQAFIAGPLANFLPLQRLPAVKRFVKANKVMVAVLTQLIKEHQETFDPTFLRDYVDVYLSEMRKNEESGNAANSVFTIDRLKGVVLDLFTAGTETTSTTLHWALRILMVHPEIQKKIHTEIDEVIGRERLPSAKDRVDMPYTDATLNEVMRFSSLVPLSVFHSNPEAVNFRDYVIPKNSFIVPNLWAMHNDTKYWSHPEKIDPTRFLGTDGKLQKKESFYPFSVGKRSCLGETLARTELFIFLTAILQKFTIVPPEADNDVSFKIKYVGFIRMLEPYKLCARKRF